MACTSQRARPRSISAQIEAAIRQGQQVLYLLPEIALTSQIIRRLQRHFGGYIGIYHSKFSQNERLEVWNKIRTGELKVIAGRAFRHFPALRPTRPHHCRRRATTRSVQTAGARFPATTPATRPSINSFALRCQSALLGSATPSVESYYNASAGKYGLVELNERYGNVRMPDIAIIDTKELRAAKSEFTRPKWRSAPGGAAYDRRSPRTSSTYGPPDRRSLFPRAHLRPTRRKRPRQPAPPHSPTPVPATTANPSSALPLHAAIEQSLAMEPANKSFSFRTARGYSPYQVCEVCGWIPQCRNCDVSLNFHKLNQQAALPLLAVPYIRPSTPAPPAETIGFVLRRNFGNRATDRRAPRRNLPQGPHRPHGYRQRHEEKIGPSIP